MAECDSKAIDPRRELRVHLAETDLIIKMRRFDSVDLIGTLDQLSAEGFSDLEQKRPKGTRATRWDEGLLTYCLWAQSPTCLRRLFGFLPAGRFYLLRILRIDGHTPWERDALCELEEKREIQRRASAEWRTVTLQHVDAMQDRWFQDKLTAIVAPTMPRRGGRRRKALSHD
ncbi:MAG TPA: hypothetical protein PKC60_04120 [Hydrogenophaga sp.]|uniref:hypothetical protein n=1 Tax=Hydrogenophaga sp. TaxID=1904254 RepID=UPI002BEC2D74|nr:hypothetical protein [Hydrogenophaga sp.]HMN92397.1 hypothetical protein [Hydrogenophaga sp.]HMP12028.1 hypothetical protein [Hydrogenophaga sp.]